MVSMSSRARSPRAAFTIVELLIVIAVITILIGLLIPAVQMIREAGRRTQCANQVKQHAAALAQFENAHGHFPPGCAHPSKTMWSAFTLPYIEYGNLYDTLDLDQTWDTGSLHPENPQSLSVLIKVFQCPSAGLDTVQFDFTMKVDRVPSCYLACASGLNNRESGDYPWAGMDAYGGYEESDGIFYINSRTKLTDISDGLSNTVLVGEAVPDQYFLDIDYSGNPQKVDHWYIGTREIVSYEESAAGSNEISECMGSTACPVNSLRLESATINDKELCFGSMHPAGVNMGFADGHVTFINNHVDAQVWSAVGSRAGREINPYIE